MFKALFWHKRDDDSIQCDLCPHRCVIREGKAGVCKARRVENGVLWADGYGRVSAVNVDPIEKKPLYHFFPGSSIFSIGSWGCNFTCRFCQNWSISQDFKRVGRVFRPDEIVSAALAEHSIGIAYTYNEPLINAEFVRDCSELAAKHELVNVLVTNGFIEKGPAETVLSFIDALNIDIKSMDDEFYRTQCGGSLGPVLQFAVQARKAGKHLEITNLLIPGLNDTEDHVERLSSWIASNLGRQTPLHLSAYHPDFKMNIPSTALNILDRAHAVCAKTLDYVYIGNSASLAGANTMCPACGSVLVSRRGYSTEVIGINGKACAKCGRAADLVLR
jgi:pyruvate formate lyase activating enzyme